MSLLLCDDTPGFATLVHSVQWLVHQPGGRGQAGSSAVTCYTPKSKMPEGLLWAHGRRGCEPSVVVTTISLYFIGTETICAYTSDTEFLVYPFGSYRLL